jgi:hypothetical protein
MHSAAEVLLTWLAWPTAKPVTPPPPAGPPIPASPSPEPGARLALWQRPPVSTAGHAINQVVGLESKRD